MTQTSAQAQVPSELVGTWHYNWVSGVHQQDPMTGHWLPPTAVDITFVFTPDGQFELRDFRQTSSWCTLTTYETASGQFRADQANVTLYPSQGHIISRATAAPTGTMSATGPASPARLGGAGVRMPSAARVGAGLATWGGERLCAGAEWGRGDAARRPARQPRPSLRLSHAGSVEDTRVPPMVIRDVGPGHGRDHGSQPSSRLPNRRLHRPCRARPGRTPQGAAGAPAASGSRPWCRRRGGRARPWRPVRGRWRGQRRAAARMLQRGRDRPAHVHVVPGPH